MASAEKTASNNPSGKKESPSAQLSADWVKVVAETIGISGTSADEAGAFKYLAEDVTFRVRSLIQDAVKLSMHSRRNNLTTHDIDFTLKMNNYEPLYGFTSSDYIPFRNASGGGRQVYFLDDKELDLDEITLKTLPKVPLETSLKSHWLAIDGVQPTVPENPPPLARDLLKLEGVNPGSRATVEKLGKPTNRAAAGSSGPKKGLKDVKLKPLTEHDLSVEQQLYYKEITEACVGSAEQHRTEALTSLAQDPGLHKMLPRLSTFICEGVKVNCVNSNLAILIYLMRMTKSLLENTSLYLEKYLHEIIPSVLTCIVSKQLCLKPENDNHWALRDFSAKILGQICKKFSSSTNDIQTRIVKILSESLHNGQVPLSTHYGCIMALAELGPGVIQSFIVPIVKPMGDRLRALLDTVPVPAVDRISSQHIKTAFVKTLAPALRVLRRPPDTLDSYRQDFGYLGAYIHEAVVRLRSQTGGSGAGTSLLHQYSSASNSAPGGSRISSASSLMNQFPSPYKPKVKAKKYPTTPLPPFPPLHPPSSPVLSHSHLPTRRSSPYHKSFHFHHLPPMGHSQVPPMGHSQVPPMGHSQVPPMGHSQVPPMGHSQVPLMGHSQVPPMGHSQVPPMGHSQVPPMGHSSHHYSPKSSRYYHSSTSSAGVSAPYPPSPSSSTLPSLVPSSPPHPASSRHYHNYSWSHDTHNNSCNTHLRNPNTMTLLTQQGGTTGSGGVSRSFSLPIGARNVNVSGVRSSASGSLPSPVIRMTGGSTSIVRTPSTPNTPGSATGTQKLIIMSTTPSASHSANTQYQHQTTPATTIVKVASSASFSTNQPAHQIQASVNKPTGQSAASGDHNPPPST